MKILLIMCGGAVGASLRYLCGIGFVRMLGKDFPYGTLFVNVLGSFLLGFLSIMLVSRVTISEDMRLALTIGVLGAFTTFSTFSLETVQLFEHGAYAKAVLNIALNLTLTILAIIIGMALAK